MERLVASEKADFSIRTVGLSNRIALGPSRVQNPSDLDVQVKFIVRLDDPGVHRVLADRM